MVGQESKRQENEDSQEPPPPYSTLVKEKTPQSRDEKQTSRKDNDSVVASANGTIWQRFRRHFKITPGPNTYPHNPQPAAIQITINNLASHHQERPRWVGPRNLLQPVPPISSYTRIIHFLHCSPEYHSEDAWRRSPWFADFFLMFYGSESGVPLQPSWRNNLDHCREDVIEPTSGPKGPGHRMQGRKITLTYFDSDPDLHWSVFIHLLHQDGPWLAGLTRREVADFVTMETALRVFAWKSPTRDPLDYPQLFYYKFLKPWFHEFDGRDYFDFKPVSYEDGLKMGIDVDEPQLRQLVDDNIEAIIQTS